MVTTTIFKIYWGAKQTEGFPQLRLIKEKLCKKEMNGE